METEYEGLLYTHMHVNKESWGLATLSVTLNNLMMKISSVTFVWVCECV